MSVAVKPGLVVFRSEVSFEMLEVWQNVLLALFVWYQEKHDQGQILYKFKQKRI